MSAPAERMQAVVVVVVVEVVAARKLLLPLQAVHGSGFLRRLLRWIGLEDCSKQRPQVQELLGPESKKEKQEKMTMWMRKQGRARASLRWEEAASNP